MPDAVSMAIGKVIIGPIISGVVSQAKEYLWLRKQLKKSDKKVSREYSLKPGYLKQAFKQYYEAADHDDKYYLDRAEATAKAADQLDSIFQKKQLEVEADSETIIEAFIKDFERRLMNHPDRATPILYEYIIRMNMRQEDFFTQFTAYYDTLCEDQEKVDQLTREYLQTTYTSERLNEQFHEEQVSQISELVSSGTSIFVTGEAGAGKSSVITRVTRKFIAANEDSSCVFIDAAQFTQVGDLSEIIGLSNNFDRVLNYILGQSASVLVTVDSLDRLADNRARGEWANILHRVSNMEDVTVLTACRAWDYEQLEFNSLRETFRDIKVEPLSGEEVRRILDSLGISEPTRSMVNLCMNPLYLSFVAEMIHDAPNADLEDIKSEIRLWHRFRESLEKEDRLGGQIDQTMVAEATRYARASLKSGKSTFQVKKHKPVVQRLIARDVIRKHKRERYKFRHEQIRLYFAAWELANQAFGLTNEAPLENPGYKTDLQFIEVLSWLERIYREDSVESSAELIQRLIDGSNLGLFVKSRTLALILQAGPSKLDAGTIELVFRQLETHIWFEFFVLHRLGTEWIDPLNQLGIFDTLSAEKLQFLRDRVTDDEEAILRVLRNVDFSTSDADPKSLVHLVLQLSTVQIAALTDDVLTYVDTFEGFAITPSGEYEQRALDRLVTGGEFNAALRWVEFVTRPQDISSERDVRFPFMVPKTSELLGPHLPTLSDHEPERCVEILERAIRTELELAYPIDPMLEVDMILGWPAERRVEELTTEELLTSSSSYGVAEFRGDRVRLLLFIYLRDCLERWVDGLESVSETPWQDTVQRYCTDDEMLFRRLGLHLVTVGRDATPELAATCALDLENYANRGLQRESVPLLYLLYQKRNDLREEIETFLNQAVDEEGWAETTRQAILTAESVDGVLETLTVVNGESDEETHESAEESLIETEIARHDSSPLSTSESPEEIVSYCAALDSNASTEELSVVVTQISQLLETDSEKYFPVLPALVPESEFLLLRLLERYAGRTPEALTEPPVFGKLIEACRSILDQTSFENTAVAFGVIDTLRTLNDWKEVAPQSDMTDARELLLDIAAAYDVQTLDEADTVGYDWRGAEPILRKDVPPQAVEAFVRLAKRMDTEDDSLSIEDRVSSLPASERVAGLQLNSGQESYRNPYQDLEIVPILDVVGVWGARTLVEELTETFLPAEHYVKEILMSANRLLQEGRKDNVVSIFNGFVSSMNKNLLLDVRFNDEELSTLLDGYALLINHVTNFGFRFSTLCRQVIILYLQTDDRVDDEQSLIRTLYALPSEATSGNSIESDIAIALEGLADDEWSRNLNWRKAVDIWKWRVQGFDGQIINDHWTEVSHLVKAISILQSEFEYNWPIDEELLDRVELESCKIWRSGDDEIVLVTRKWAINHQDTAEFVGQFFSDRFTASPRATYFLLNYRDLEAPLDLWHDSILLAREDMFAWPWLLRGIASMALSRREDSIELLEKLLRLIPLSSSWEFVLERYEEYILVTLCLALDSEETHGKARSIMDLYARKFNRVEILELLEGIAQDFPRE